MSHLPNPDLFHLMADQVQDYAIFLLDPQGHVMSWNAGARVIKQYEAHEIIGRHFSAFYTDEDIAVDWPGQELRRAKTEGRFEDEGWRVKKDGSRFWANVIITALRGESGELLAFSKITRDLTERKRQEEILRLTEERFRLLVEGVEDYAIYLLDPSGVVTSWNSGARRIKGYDATEIIGQHFSQFYTSEDIQAGRPWAELAVARSLGRAEDEGWRLRKDGTRFWARVVVTALKDDAGRPMGFAKVTQDLTLRKHSEALELASSKVNEFIAVLAHELRNPLAPIRSAVHILRRSAVAGSTDERLAQIIDRQSSHLVRIVDDLLDVSRITRGTLSVARKRIAVSDIVARSLETARPNIDAAAHALTLEIDDQLEVEADEIRLTQALSNLLNNAARYTAPGGAIHIAASAFQSEGRAMARITVRDNGRGVDPALTESIFGMFVQGTAAIDRPMSGLGVGLALARSLVELHHGKLTVHSEGPGKGSEFSIELPAVSPAGVPMSAVPERARAATRDKPRVLVVDDNVDAAETVVFMLRSEGHEVFSANSGEAAIEIFSKVRPAIVLLDIGMPGMDGLELARRLRALNSDPRPLLIAVTGWGQPADARETKAAGIDMHLVKPVEEVVLLRAMQTTR